MAKVRSRAELKTVVERLVTKWADYFGISQTNEIELIFTNLESHNEVEGDETRAAVFADDTYARIVLKLDPDLLASDPTDKVERIVIHEFVHALHRRLTTYLAENMSHQDYGKATQLIEEHTDMLSQIILRLSGKAQPVRVTYKD